MIFPGGLEDIRRLCKRNIPAYKLDFTCDNERAEHGSYPPDVELIQDEQQFMV